MDDKLVEAVARAIYDALEGPVSNQDFNRQCAQWDLSKSAAHAALAVVQPEINRLREALRPFACDCEEWCVIDPVDPAKPEFCNAAEARAALEGRTDD